MHFLAVLNSPDSQKLLATAQQMAGIMAGYATLYAYDNLSTDPSPGQHLLPSTHHSLTPTFPTEVPMPSSLCEIRCQGVCDTLGVATVARFEAMD